MLWTVTVLYLFSTFFVIDCRNQQEVVPRIIGGKVSNVAARPFMLSLHSPKGFQCGATVLSKTWGITALHCLPSRSENKYYVRAGSSSPSHGGSVHNLTKIHVYNDSTFNFFFSKLHHYDIALFQVFPPFRFSKTLHPAQLPKESSKVPESLVVSGWGQTATRRVNPRHMKLMAVRVPYVPFEKCVKISPCYRRIVRKDRHLCFGSSGKDACFGDSGGPLANKNTIYGVVSFGLGCGQVSGVYAKIAFYRHWIKEMTGL